MMNTYIDSNNQLYGFDSSDTTIPAGLVLIPSSYTANQYPFITLVNGVINFNQAAFTAAQQAELIAQYEYAAQETLDSVAQSWGYDSLLSAASYVNSTVAQYKADAAALLAWRDTFWQSAYTLEASVTAGTQSLPATASAFIALLPPSPTRPTA